MKLGLECLIFVEWSGESKDLRIMYHLFSLFLEFQWLLELILKGIFILVWLKQTLILLLWICSFDILFRNLTKRESTGGKILSLLLIMLLIIPLLRLWKLLRASSSLYCLLGHIVTKRYLVNCSLHSSNQLI